MPPSPIIFHQALCEAAAKSPRHAAPLLHKWAARPAELGGPALRAQLDGAAAAVPEAKRSRVLGQLLAKSAPDDRVRAATGCLLLGKMLLDHGWDVEFEPEVDGGTPDLKVSKNHDAHLIEVHRVACRPENPGIPRVRDALDDVTTHTPISLRAVRVDPGASLKGFKRKMKAMLAGELAPGRHTCEDDGVFVSFEVRTRWPEPVAAIFSFGFEIVHGRPEDEVREHIDSKLRKYKLPLIVALDFFDSFDCFRTVEEVLIGREVFKIPIDLAGNGSAGEPTLSRAHDGLLYHRGRAGERARERLQAVLPFTFVAAADGRFAIRARLMANPAAEPAVMLEGFAPVPRLVVVSETETRKIMQYVDAHGAVMDQPALADWRHVP